MKFRDVYTVIGGALFLVGTGHLLFQPNLENWMPGFMRSQVVFVNILTDSMLMGLGAYLTFKKKEALICTLLIFGSLTVFFGSLELVLRTGILDDLENPHPVWIPARYHDLDHDMVRENEAVARTNEFGFTGPNPAKEKKNHFRIAILGDSFIWGDGVAVQELWPHRLEQKLKESFPKVEVLSWGKRSWSTLDQFEFLKEHGFEYKPDLILVGFVINDTDLRADAQKFMVWHRFFVTARQIFPNATEFFFSYLNNVLERFIFTDFNSDRWLEKLYSEENLTQYQRLLYALRLFCNEKGLPIYFIFTPESSEAPYRERIEHVIPLLDRAQIPYLNLHPVVKKELGSIPSRRLWANPANPHPGVELNELFAEETYKFLRGYLEQGVDKRSNHTPLTKNDQTTQQK